eukprot:TRINITY_DN4693_c0_g2_i2.p1 TRINITY_DN4693_c0_g2~~TRINITY_DN4693_c0_g2_i2.p1  ORF type:complete len:481 (+),score=126.24 TRINITY_DN4693_c0_g2_i2:142-1443(+)
MNSEEIICGKICSLLKLGNHDETALLQLNLSSDPTTSGKRESSSSLMIVMCHTRGKVLQSLGKSDAALLEFKKALEYNSSTTKTTTTPITTITSPTLINSHVKFFCGVCLQALGKSQESLKEFKALLEFSPTYFPAIMKTGHVLIQMREWEKAISQYDTAFSMLNTPMVVKARALCKKASVHLELGQIVKALSNADAAIEMTPQSFKALHIKGMALHHLGKLDDATAILSYCLKLNPDFKPAQDTLQICLKKKAVVSPPTHAPVPLAPVQTKKPIQEGQQSSVATTTTTVGCPVGMSKDPLEGFRPTGDLQKLMSELPCAPEALTNLREIKDEILQRQDTSELMALFEVTSTEASVLIMYTQESVCSSLNAALHSFFCVQHSRSFHFTKTQTHLSPKHWCSGASVLSLSCCQSHTSHTMMCTGVGSQVQQPSC